MRIEKIIKFTLYPIAGILIIIFRNSLINYIPYLVGGIMLAFSIDGIISAVRKRNFFGENSYFFDDLILLLLAGVMLFITNEDFDIYCVIWAVWSILREGREIKEKALPTFKVDRVLSILNIIESVVVIVLSVLLIVDPLEHAAAHIILLGVELILEAVFHFGNIMTKKRRLAREKKTKENAETTQTEN